MSALYKQEGGNHYKDFPIQPVEFITKNRLGFLEGCVIKRLCRWQAKDGIKDLRKAIHEIELLIELTETAEKNEHMEREAREKLAVKLGYPMTGDHLTAEAKAAVERAQAAETIERALKPKLDDYLWAPGTLIPAGLPDGTVIWEWCATADHRRVGVMHRGQLVRDPVAG